MGTLFLITGGSNRLIDEAITTESTMEDGQDVLVEVVFKVRPLHGYWKTTNGQEVVLKQSQTIKYYKKLPISTDNTSKTSSGIYKNKGPETWKKPKDVTASSSIHKNKDYSLSSTTPSMSSVPSRKKVVFSGIRRSRRPICMKKSVTEPKKTETKKKEAKKVETKPEEKPEEVEESYDLELWTVLSLLWLFLFILHYFLVLEEEDKNF